MRVLIRLLKILLPLVILGVAGFAAYLLFITRPQVETLIPTVAAPGVRAQLVTLETVQIAVASQGTVRPQTETQLVPEVAGRVTWVAPSFAEGGFFEAGDVLVSLDRFDYQQAAVSARSQLAQTRLRLAQEEAEAEVAQREWENLGRGDPRALTLREPQLEDARASVAAAEANVERAERDLERADVIAPYSGRVRSKSVDVGQFVTVGSPIAAIYAIDKAEVGLALPDEELAYLDLPLAHRGEVTQVGPRVVLSTTFAGATYEWDGRVVRTESELDPVTRMVQVVAEVEDPYAQTNDPRRPPLSVGMYVEAEIQGRSFEEIAVIPRAALRGRNQVLVIDADSRIQFRDIEILRATTDSIYVNRGLSAGEIIAVSPLDSPADGLLVQIADLDIDRFADTTAPPVSPSVPVVVDAEPETTTTAPSVSPSAPAIVDAGPGTTPETEVSESEPPTWLLELLNDASATPNRSAQIENDQADLTDDTLPPDTRDAPASSAATPEPPSPVIDAAPPPTVPAVEFAPLPRNAVALIPFENITQANQNTSLATDLTQAVRTQLEDTDSITVVPSETEAILVIGGGVQQQDGSVRITARIIDTRNGDVIKALKLDGPVTELPQIQSNLVTAIHESVADTFETGETIPETFPAAAAVDTASGISITVQRFENVTDTPQTTQFEDAIRTAVAERLQMVEGVTLVAPEAQPQWTVNGGIQQSGNLVRITATLIDSRDDSVLRAVKVDGVTDDLSSVQGQVASAIYQTVVEMLNGTTGDTTTTAGTPITIRPFTNISQRPEDTELADSVAATITNRLNTARATSIVTTEENALWIISGSIQRIGNIIRITVNLIDREENSVVHSIKIDGPVDQLERLQNDVATELTNTVQEATS